jgi:hypothetical protein
MAGIERRYQHSQLETTQEDAAKVMVFTDKFFKVILSQQFEVD